MECHSVGIGLGVRIEEGIGAVLVKTKVTVPTKTLRNVELEYYFKVKNKKFSKHTFVCSTRFNRTYEEVGRPADPGGRGFLIYRHPVNSEENSWHGRRRRRSENRWPSACTTMSVVASCATAVDRLRDPRPRAWKTIITIVRILFVAE